MHKTLERVKLTHRNVVNNRVYYDCPTCKYVRSGLYYIREKLLSSGGHMDAYMRQTMIWTQNPLGGPISSQTIPNGNEC